MKLVTKFTLWYLTITTLVLLLTCVVVFYSVQREIEKEVTRRLRRDIDHTAELIKDGVSIDSLANGQIEITELNFNEPVRPLKKSDSMVRYSPSLKVLDRKFSVESSYKISGKHYHISSHNLIAEPDEILEGILFSLGVALLILIVFVGLASLLMSKQILSPFNQMLRAIQSFTLTQKNRIKLPETTTYEFTELNRFLEKMTSKALDDYRSLKEFSENASHELQTPLAIMRGKLDLLMETNIDEEQASFILSIQNAIQKLSSINQSITLLTKLENQEYQVQRINLSRLADNNITALRELIEMKAITLTTEIQADVYVDLNPVLADILLTNLIGNAIRHNYINGSISISLSPATLVIKNTGAPLRTEPHELFKRFKKGEQSTDSTGLGLAIVKQICDLNNFKIEYLYMDGIHTVKVIYRS